MATTTTNQIPFIGIGNLKTVLNRIEPNILMGPAYYDSSELQRLGINVLTGIQFMSTKYVFFRKGGTTRRKHIGDKVNSTLGFLQERPLVTYVVWNHYTDNQGNYRELPVTPVGDGAKVSYPMSELAINENVGKAFSDDVFSNLWWGDKELDKSDDPEKKAMGLYDGFNTVIAFEMESGLISKKNGNLIHCDAIDAPASKTDTAAWKAFRAAYLSLPVALRRVPILAYMSTDTSVAISDAYGNAHYNHKEAIMVGDGGNFKFEELPKVTVVPSDDYGKGDRIVFTVPGNLEIGVNDGDPVNNYVGVKEGTDNDLTDIQFQVQTTIGTRVVALMPSKFAVTDGSLVQPDNIASGDYKFNTLTTSAAPADGGSVKVEGATPNANGEYAAGTALSLTATAASGYKFVKWSNGSTNPALTYITKNQPDAVVAIFEKETAKPAETGTGEGAGTEGKGEGE